jgi:hypothetical protein
MSHVELNVLADYWASALTPEQEAAVEAHTFECDDCSRRLTAIGQLADGVAQTIARQGGFEFVGTASLIDQLERDGVIVRRYEAKLGDSVPCGVGARDDLVVTIIKADLAAYERVGFRLFASGDRLVTQGHDIPVDRATGSLIYTLSGDRARDKQFEDYVRGGPPPPPGTKEVLPLTAKFFAIEDDRERPLGEVVFMHTPFSA